MKYSFRRIETASEFKSLASKYLLMDEAKNNFIIGMLDEALTLEDASEWIFAIVCDPDALDLVFICNGNGSAMAFCHEKIPSYELLEFAAEEIYKLNKEISEIKASPEVATALSNHYSDLINKKAEISMRIRGLMLDRLNEIDTRGLKIRKATLADWDVLFQNCYNMNIDVYGKKTTDEAIKNQCDKFLNEGMYFLEDNNTVVSQAVHRRKISIGGVYTPKEFRGNGYCTICIYLLSKMIMDHGAKYCVIHTDDASEISNHVYVKVGYKYSFDLLDIVFE